MHLRAAWRIALAIILATAAAGGAHADNYPMGTIAFFNLSACPTGWGPALDASNESVSGSYLVPFVNPPAGMLGTKVGRPLASGEDRVHSHSLSGSISLDDVSYAGSDSCCDENLTSSGSQSFSTQTSNASSGMPYVQLLICQKNAFTRNENPPQGVPGNIVTFFVTTACPTGWKQTLATTGRFLVGLPANGTPGVTFGGNPLRAGEDRQHTHAFSGSVSVSSHGTGTSAGCCAGGYGGAGTYDYSGTTGATSAGLPYMLVTQCQPCSVNDDDPQCAQASRSEPKPVR